MFDRSAVREGMAVLDLNGDKVGSVAEPAAVDYVRVSSGLLGIKQYYVPSSAVAEVRDEAVYLSAKKDALDTLGWHEPPPAALSTLSPAQAEVVDETELQTVPLREEQLEARTEQVQAGEVRLGKDIVEHQQTLSVPVIHEEVVIERRPVERVASQPIDPSVVETISVPVSEQRVEVTKEPVVYEEVRIGTREVLQTAHMADTVRREEAHLERHGEVIVHGWNEVEPVYRERWQQHYGQVPGATWDVAAPAYEYGYTRRGAYAGRTWLEAEPEVRREWEQTHPDAPWDSARDYVRSTWDESDDGTL